MSNPDLAFREQVNIERDSKKNGFKRASTRPGQNTALKAKGVEGWRGLACLLVVVFHVWQTMDLNNSGVGPYADNPNVFNFYYNVDLVVDLFFVLSGLLLFMPFANAALYREVTVPVARSFLYRRLLRVLPVYWLVVLFSWFPRNFGIKDAQWLDLLEHLFLVQSFDSERIFYTVGPAWTLSVELMFYLTLTAIGPSFVRWVREGFSKTTRINRLFWPIVAVIFASFLYKVNVEMFWNIPVTDWAWRFGPAAKADSIAFGMLLAIVVASLKRKTIPSIFSPIFIIVGVFIIYTFLYRFGQVPSELFLASRHTMAALGWTLILAGITLVKTNWPAKIIDNKIAVKLSIVAYCVYLIHEPLLLAFTKTSFWNKDPSNLILNTIVVAIITLITAWLVHRFVEEPWIDMGALRNKNGGRKELYPDIFLPTEPRPILKTNVLRTDLLAKIGETK